MQRNNHKTQAAGRIYFIIGVVCVVTSIVCGQNNAALGKAYQVSQSPYTFQHDCYKDSDGPDAFSQTHTWYRG